MLLRKLLKGTAIAALVVAILFASVYAWKRYEFPYGFKHACLKGIGFGLLNYAEAHDGRFPAGGGSPEASLSLLYRDGHENANNLSGKTKSTEAAQAILDRGELLGPETCDWHYVEGLTLSDNPRLALIWDKVGLGHDGQRLSDGGHSVWRICPGEEVVSEADWPKFLEEQERLMATRTEAAKKGLLLLAKIRLPSGEIVEESNSPYKLEIKCDCRDFSSPLKSSSGKKLEKSAIQWRKLPCSDGELTLVLSLKDSISKPVSVHMQYGRATPDVITFEMLGDNGPVQK